MTEEEKLKWLKDVLDNGVNVAQINLGNGIQNIQINTYGQITSEPIQENGGMDSPSNEESEASSSLASSNIIFNAHIFTTETDYERLREAIFAFFKCKNEDKRDDNHQIVPATQAEWYFILKAIDEAGVTGHQKLTTANFLKQMLAWYPSFFIRKNEKEDDGRMLRRYASSISAERNKWTEGIDRHEVSIRNMFALSNTRGYDKAKTLRLHGVAEELKKQLLEIVQSVSSK